MQNLLPYRYLHPEGKQLAIDMFMVMFMHDCLYSVLHPLAVQRRHDQNAHWLIKLTSTSTFDVASRCLLIFDLHHFIS